MIKPVLGDDDRAKVPAILPVDDDGDDQRQVPAILMAMVFACVGVTIICTVVKSKIEIAWAEDLQLKGRQSKLVIAYLFFILCSICVLWIAAMCCVEAYLSGRRQRSIPDVEKCEVDAVENRPLLRDSVQQR